MTIEQMDPKTAFEQMQKEKDMEFLDVRTVEEFIEGHPEGSKNIPIIHMDPRTGQQLPNPDFQQVIEKNIPKDKAIFITCRTGQRSFMAAMQMEVWGYTKLINVKGGFAGSETTTGWKELGLPVSNENGPGISHESLMSKNKA